MPQPPSNPNEGFSAKPLAGPQPFAPRSARPAPGPEASQQNPTAGMPGWLVVLGSLAIAFHLLGVLSGALAAPSGPWPMPDGSSNMSPPPQFALSLHDALEPVYLKPIKMTRLPINQPEYPGVYFEVRLKDETGQELATVKIPDPDANFWVHQRQSLLARALADDQMVASPQSEVIAAPGQQVPTVPIWEPESADVRIGKLVQKPLHLIPRDRPVQRPSEVSLLLARSYVRYLCRTHGAASGELVRHIRSSIPPAVLFEDNVQAGNLDNDMMSNFGELPR